MSLARPRGPLEIRVLPDDGRSRAHVLRLSAGAQRALAALGVACALLVAAGLATAPTVVTSLLLSRDYELQASRRLQLGERLQALVDRLGELRRRGGALAERLERVQAVYELGDGVGLPSRAGAFTAGATPDSIFASTIDHGNRLAAELGLDLALARERLERIARFEASHADLVRSIPTRSPLAGSTFVLSSVFGSRRSVFTRELEPHFGLDLAAPAGTPILAPAAGIVTFAGAVAPDRRSDWWRFGRLVVLRHGDQFLTLYGHCDKLVVRRGQRVDAGQRLATVGETGWATAPHLHYEIRRRRPAGEWLAVDPLDYALGLAEIEGAPRRSARRGREAAAGEARAPLLLPAFLR
jgi:murein DD-endopeptidase MepM/ murein hydrolase activator NlpD